MSGTPPVNDGSLTQTNLNRSGGTPEVGALGAVVRELGGYHLISEIGHGAMGEVWLSKDPRLERNVAIKMMRCEIAGDPMFIQRFHREAKAVAKLSHPNVVQIYSIGEEAGLLYFVMEWVDGKTLSEKIKETGAVPRKEALSIIMQAADGLDYACNLGVIHRDIKPGNMMIDARGRVKITDFGLAKLGGSDTQFTSIGTPLGSPNYMSPESCRGELLDHRSDIYSLGVTLYQILLGELPYSASDPMSVMFKQVNEPLPEPETLRMLDNGIWLGLLQKMTAKNVADRFQTYGELREALHALNSGSTGSVQSVVVSQGLMFNPASPNPSTARTGTFTTPVAQYENTGARARLLKWGAGALAAISVIGVGVYWFLNSDIGTSSPSVTTSNDSSVASAAHTSAQGAPALNEQPSASPSQQEEGGVPRRGPVQDMAEEKRLTEVFAALPPEILEARRNYDFDKLSQLLQQAIKSNQIKPELQNDVQNILTNALELKDFRKTLAELVHQSPGASSVTHAQYGTIYLTGVTDSGLQFETANKTPVQVSWPEMTAAHIVALTKDLWGGEAFRPKAEALFALYPSARRLLGPPQNGQGPGGGPGGRQGGPGRPGGPRAGGGPAGNRQQPPR